LQVINNHTPHQVIIDSNTENLHFYSEKAPNGRALKAEDNERLWTESLNAVKLPMAQ